MPSPEYERARLRNALGLPVEPATRWRFDAIEDRAVFELLTGARPRYKDGPLSRRLFWVKYQPAREAFVGAVGLCLKWHRDTADLVCVLHG